MSSRMKEGKEEEDPTLLVTWKRLLVLLPLDLAYED